MPGLRSGRRGGVKRRRATVVAAGRPAVRRKLGPLQPLRSLSYKRMFPVTKSMRTTLRYVQRGLNINPPAAGLAGSFVFSANGLYDPDISGVGHQPIGFDQIMALYDHYTVKAAKIVVDFRNDDTTNPVFGAIAVRDSSVADTDPAVVVENGNVDYTLMNNAPNDGNMCRITMYTDIAKYLGRKSLLSDPECKGTAAANPTEQVYFHIFIWSHGGGIDAGASTMFVTIDYDVVFHERKPVALS